MGPTQTGGCRYASEGSPSGHRLFSPSAAPGGACPQAPDKPLCRIVSARPFARPGRVAIKHTGNPTPSIRIMYLTLNGEMKGDQLMLPLLVLSALLAQAQPQQQPQQPARTRNQPETPAPATAPAPAATTTAAPARSAPVPAPQGRRGAGGIGGPGPAIGGQIDESLSVTHHTIKLDNGPLTYTATVGQMPLKDPSGETEAHIFYMAYTK